MEARIPVLLIPPKHSDWSVFIIRYSTFLSRSMYYAIPTQERGNGEGRNEATMKGRQENERRQRRGQRRTNEGGQVKSTCCCHDRRKGTGEIEKGGGGGQVCRQLIPYNLF